MRSLSYDWVWKKPRSWRFGMLMGDKTYWCKCKIWIRWDHKEESFMKEYESVNMFSLTFQMRNKLMKQGGIQVGVLLVIFPSRYPLIYRCFFSTQAPVAVCALTLLWGCFVFSEIPESKKTDSEHFFNLFLILDKYISCVYQMRFAFLFII